MDITLVNVAVFAAGFVLGFGVHYLLCQQEKGRRLTKENGAWMFISLISIIWSVSVLAEIQLDTYSTPIAIHGLMGYAAGYVLEMKISDKILRK